MKCRGDNAAERQRRRRARQRHGLVCVRLELEHDAVVEALLRSGRLSEEAAHDAVVERAMAGVLDEWAKRWLERELPDTLKQAGGCAASWWSVEPQG